MYKETKQYTYKDGAQFVFMDLVLLFFLFIQFTHFKPISSINVVLASVILFHFHLSIYEL